VSYFQVSILAFSALAIIVFIAMFMISRRDRLRSEYYNSELQKVELDRTREVLERQISDLYNQIYRDKGRFNEINQIQLSGEMANPITPATGIFKAPKFLQRMGVAESVEIERKFVFLLTPFSTSERETFDTVHVVCSNVGLNVRRGDEKRVVGPILPHILHELAISQIVICNLNSRNPNVLYELGIAHAIGKPVILIAEASEDLPFDVSHFSIILYEDHADLREKLTSAISRLALSGDLESQTEEVREQEAIVELRSTESLPNALAILQGHSNISRAFILDDARIYVSGKSPSPKFISDIGDILRQHGITPVMSRLIR
jgi:hypothetical protein|tara:strand:- start:161 stop:1117 length:957 start_codon:yes stop_codon:yes gene_type:complete